MHHVEARKITYKIANALIVVLMLFLIVITIYPMYYTICASFSVAPAFSSVSAPGTFQCQYTSLFSVRRS